MTPPRPLGVGLVGLGYAAEFHLPAVRSLPELRLVAVCDRDPARLDRVSRRQSVSAVTDYRALIGRPDVDVVGVLTPPTTHLDIVLAALAAGKHILLEKPIAGSLEEADRMVAAARHSRAKVCVAYVLRFIQQVREVRRLLSQGDLGQIELLRCLASTPQMLSPDAPGHRRDRGQGGGSVIELGVHHYDLWAHLLESRVVEVSAFCRSLRMHDQSAVVSARMSCGTLATTCITLCGADQYQVEAIGSHARATASLLRYDGLQIVRAGEGAGRGFLYLGELTRVLAGLPHASRAMRHGGTFRDSFRELWRHLADSIIRDVPPAPGLQEGRASLAVAIASSRASLEGGTVRVADIG